MTQALCLVMGVLLSVLSCRAQSHLGILGQGLASDLPGSASALPGRMNPRPSLGGGLWADVRLSDYIDFQPSLLLSPKGAQFQQNYVRLSYLELPLLLMYRIPCGYDDFFLGGGVYGALGLQGTYRTVEDSLPGGASGEVNFGTPSRHFIPGTWFRPFDAGYTVSASYQWSFGFTLNLHFSRGFINTNPPGTGRMGNQALRLGVGYLFHYNTRD